MESRKLSKEPNDYFSEEEIASAKERFPQSDRIHKLIARLDAAERIVKIVEKHGDGSLWNECEAWRKVAGK